MIKISIAAVCALAVLSSAAISTSSPRNHPAKAAPTAPLAKAKRWT